MTSMMNERVAKPLTEVEIEQKLGDFVHGGADCCEEMLAAGAPIELVEEARRFRREWDRELCADVGARM